MKSLFRCPLNGIASIAAVLLAASLAAQTNDPSLPHLVQKDGHHAFIVDGAPFLMLGGQCHNSSAWPSTLPKVWSALETLHANTLEAPVSWEQFEPEPGKFDYAVVDQLLAGAREHRVRLVLLWFGTWKNGSAHYLPLWMKQQPELYPRIIGKKGNRIDSPSPHTPALLAADIRAFSALMRHLKAADPQHTAIMVQVENEPGSWDTVRDYSPAAEKLFAAPIPIELLKALALETRAGDNWTTVFGKDADEFFHAWSVAHFIGQVAAAGKAEYPLPLYVNAALRDPLNNPPATSYESGGPTDNVLAIWKAAAPAVDILAPDIYMDDSARYFKVLDLYSRADNPLFIPETSRSTSVSRYCYAAIAHGAIGWSPFGIDRQNQIAVAPGATPPDALALESIASNFLVLGPMMRELAKFNFEGRLHAAVEEKGTSQQLLALGRWQATIHFGQPAFGYGRTPQGNPEPMGSVLIAQLGENEFLVTAHLARIDFKLADATAGLHRDFLRVEEGQYENGVFRPARIWNGDETDWGLNFGTVPQVLRAQLGTF